jgi:Reverse transcriptase (RNA-dependent DNA polymerase)
VWTKKVRKDVAVGQRLVGCKWVFKKKKLGTFCACLVALGYNQMPGVDYSDSFAPVINDVSLRLVILLWLQNDWHAKIVDVETTFLYSDFDEKVYMKFPSGYQVVVESIDENISAWNCKKINV